VLYFIINICQICVELLHFNLVCLLSLESLYQLNVCFSVNHRAQFFLVEESFKSGRYVFILLKFSIKLRTHADVHIFVHFYLVFINVFGRATHALRQPLFELLELIVYRCQLKFRNEIS
jgi:hypothetical protein